MPSLSSSTTTEDRRPFHIQSNNFTPSSYANLKTTSSHSKSSSTSATGSPQRSSPFSPFRQIVPQNQRAPQNEFYASNISTSVPLDSQRRPGHSHTRSNSFSGAQESTGNLNRWSQSTASSKGEGLTRSRSNSLSSRLSFAGQGLSISAGISQFSPKRLQKNRRPSGSSPQRLPPVSLPVAQRVNPGPLLPPIVTLPSLQHSVNGSSPLTGTSPSTAGILSAAVRSTVPDYFGRTWDDSTPKDFAHRRPPSRSGSNSVESVLVSTLAPAFNPGPAGEEQSASRGHSRNRSQAGKSSSSSHRSSKQPSQKAMLSKALQKANTAVLLDNAQNFEGATQAYSEACALLQQVMLRSSGDEDRRKLEAIVGSTEKDACSIS